MVKRSLNIPEQKCGWDPISSQVQGGPAPCVNADHGSAMALAFGWVCGCSLQSTHVLLWGQLVTAVD